MPGGYRDITYTTHTQLHKLARILTHPLSALLTGIFIFQLYICSLFVSVFVLLVLCSPPLEGSPAEHLIQICQRTRAAPLGFHCVLLKWK